MKQGLAMYQWLGSWWLGDDSDDDFEGVRHGLQAKVLAANRHSDWPGHGSQGEVQAYS